MSCVLVVVFRTAIGMMILCVTVLLELMLALCAHTAIGSVTVHH